VNFFKKLFSPIIATLKFIQDYFKSILFLFIVFLIFISGNKQHLTQNNLQKITLSGPIFDVSQTLEQINEAATNKNIKGVLFEINSPGGAVAPSIELSFAIKRLRKKKPVVVYASGILTSGGYYASIWADKIVANPGAIVGSIGVIVEGADLSSLMDKIGIKTQTVQAGKYKKVGTPERKWFPYEKAELTKVIQDTYKMFVKDVAKARGLKLNQSNEFADAHIFTATQAQKVGLVDMIGVEYDAKEMLVLLSKVKKPLWNKENDIDKILKKFTLSASSILYTYFPAFILK